jgi:hypothetical protein
VAIAKHIDAVHDSRGFSFARGADENIAIRDWIERGLRDPEAQWSAGTYGAIAEFSRDPSESAEVVYMQSGGQVSTARGGIRVELREGIRAVAYEMTSKNRDQWGHAIALCLRAEDCGMGRRTTIHELGPDATAIRPQDRTSILFDLGLNASQVDVCVRTSEPEMLSALRAGEGRSVFDMGNPATAAIFRASPNRVFLTKIGRAEVYQPIPPADGRSPDGPHTHILPKLLRSGRTHPATVPIPSDWIPCLHLYPSHPGIDGLDVANQFDRAKHEASLKSLALFGDPELFELKWHVFNSVTSGRGPEALTVPKNRFARGVIRVALRQLHAMNGPSPNLSRWRQRYDLADSTESSDEC